MNPYIFLKIFMFQSKGPKMRNLGDDLQIEGNKRERALAGAIAFIATTVMAGCGGVVETETNGTGGTNNPDTTSNSGGAGGSETTITGSGGIATGSSGTGGMEKPPCPPPLTSASEVQTACDELAPDPGAILCASPDGGLWGTSCAPDIKSSVEQFFSDHAEAACNVYPVDDEGNAAIPDCQ